MKILVAPNSMKGSLNAFEFADIVESALLQSELKCTVRKVPVADGGDFTGEILSQVAGAKPVNLEVKGPLGNLTSAKYWISESIAIIEMAEASGMKKVDSERLDPLKASSFGTGQLINDSIKKGCTEIWLTIGGSATVDGGMGMLEALGFRFIDKKENDLIGNGENLSKIEKIQKPDFQNKFLFKIICDVNNPLLGENGAAQVFGPQKGATPEMVIELEKGLKNWNEILLMETGKDYSVINGTGAAGGVSLGLLAFFNATIEPGASFILDKLNFNDHVNWADIIITGEGKVDRQTNSLKAPYVVAQKALNYYKPVYAFAGISEESQEGIFTEVITLTNKNISKKAAMANACDLLFQRVSEFAKQLYLKNE